MRALGLLARLSYRLSRQRLLGLPLDVALMLLAAAAGGYDLVYALFLERLPLSPLLVAALGLWALLALALRLRAFVLFRPQPAALPAPGTLAPFQPLPVRASGYFEVNGQRRYYVEAAGKLEATGLGERILMVQVARVSLLGLLSSPEDEWGWWYAFFRPEEVRSATPGRLCFGWRARPALRLEFATGAAHIHLSFDDPASRELVRADLAGPQLAGGNQ